MREGFDGCIRNFVMYGKPLKNPVLEDGVKPCSDLVEPGAFFSATGGYIIACKSKGIVNLVSSRLLKI